MNHTFVALVEDKPGVLNRVASLFRRRTFNIESLTVGRTEQPGVSRMTIVVDSDEVSARAREREPVQAGQCDPGRGRDRQAHGDPRPGADQGQRRARATAPRSCRLVDVFRARIVDVANDSLIVEITGDEEKIEGMIEVLRPFGIIEMVRTGVVAMARGANAAASVNRQRARRRARSH